jgi:hypothetical protein
MLATLTTLAHTGTQGTCRVNIKQESSLYLPIGMLGPALCRYGLLFKSELSISA